MKRLQFAVLLVATGLTQNVFANRSVTIAPILVRSIAGGAMQNGGSTVACVTADMNAADYQGTVPNDGVCYGTQSVTINLRNVSTVTQTVRIVMAIDSSVTSSNSGGSSSAVPIVGGPSDRLAADSATSWVPIPAGGRYNFEFTSYCDATRCFMIEQAGPQSGRVLLGSRFPTAPAACSGATQVCLSMASEFGLRLEVTEDRGAMVAHITTHAHRSQGHKDHFIQPPFAVAVNGGRAF